MGTTARAKPAAAPTLRARLRWCAAFRAILPSLGDKLFMFVTGIVLFSIPLQLGFAALNLVRKRLSRQPA